MDNIYPETNRHLDQNDASIVTTNLCDVHGNGRSFLGRLHDSDDITYHDTSCHLCQNNASGHERQFLNKFLEIV